MAKDLKVYNHLNYKMPSEESDGFVEFLHTLSTPECPEVDENRAWEKINERIFTKRKSFVWMKVAAAVAILVSLSVAMWLYNPDTSQIHVASKDQIINVTFPDGSVAVLNRHSSVTYPEEFEGIREISFQGEAYFQVQKNEMPFVIDAEGVNVKVLGTAFNLATTRKEVRLFVDHGLVAMGKGETERKVEAGKEAIFNKANNRIALNEKPSANIMSWRNGEFVFDKTPLDQALAELSKYYNITFEVTNEKLKACKISATFKNQTLKEVLETIGTALNVKATIKGDVVKISGQGC